MDIFSLLGWLGSFLVLAAYWLNSAKYIEATSVAYQLMNLLGAVGLGINVFHQDAWPSFAVNAIWGVIALYSLIKKK
jgi:hypothetical protein